MKKGAHIPHNYETTFEIRQDSASRSQEWCLVILEKQR